MNEQTRMNELYRVMKDVTDMWLEVQAILQGPPFKIEGFPISLRRDKSALRLCYNDQPIDECSLEEKLDALQYLSELKKHVRAHRDNLLVRAKAAQKTLDDWLRNVQ